MAVVVTTTKTPVKNLMHLLMSNIRGVQTQKLGEPGLLVDISGLCAKIINDDATEVFTENITCNGVDCQLKLARIPYTIHEIGINDEGLTEFRISQAPKEIRGDKDAINTLTRYLEESKYTGTMIEVDSTTHDFMACVTELYNAIFGNFYVDSYRIYTIEELNMLFMHRGIPYQLCKINVITEQYAHHPMPGFTIEKCRW